MIMKILNYVSRKLIMIAIACSFAASTPLQAGEARLNSASASSEDGARLIVARVANFGTFNHLNLFVNGVYVADLGKIFGVTGGVAPWAACVVGNPGTIVLHAVPNR